MTLRQIGNYRLDSLPGTGGMGEVSKAYDTRRDRFVALKLMPQALSGDREYLSRFQRESNVAARLRDPHVIPIRDFGEIDGARRQAYVADENSGSIEVLTLPA